MRARAAFLVIVATVLSSAASWAQVKSPQDLLGFRVGDDYKLADWQQITAYFNQLDKASDRVRVDVVGETTLKKPFLRVTITSPANQATLARYEEITRRLADPRGLSADEAERLIGEGKSVIAITCSVHATEVAAAQMSMELAYNMATQNSTEVANILDNVIFLLVPSLNPDGLDIVVNWYKKNLKTPFEAAPVPELYHHYTGHDNNRDWYMFTQVETQHTIAKLHNVWHPQIVYDVHQMGATAARIFVPPWMDPVDPNIDPILQQMTLVVGTSMATDLTAAGRKGVVMNAMYDLWTPSRHYQNYHGGIRILTESASVRIASPVTVKFEQLDAGRGYDARRPSWN
ncbi:MAG: M14 family zinc carboxypeptidase, partial [Gammaproteobacteria bacterium]